MKILNCVLLILVISGSCSCTNRRESKIILNKERMENMNEFKITLAQIKHASWDFNKQSEYVLDALRDQIRNSTDIIVLPEMCPGKIDKIKNEAIRLNAHIVAGVSEKTGSSSFINKAVVINPEGNVISEYSKMFLHQEEIDYGYEEGNSSVVFNIGEVRIGILICGDLGLGVEASLNLFHKNVDLIIIPASAYSNSLEYWKWHMVVKSLDIGIPICMVNYADFSINENYTSGGGHSMVVTPLPKGHENKHIDSFLQDKNIKPMDHIYCELNEEQVIKTVVIDLTAYKNYRSHMQNHRNKGLNLLKNLNND